MASTVTKLLTVPFPTVRSVLSKPVTSSLKVAVTLNAPLIVVAEVDAKVTVGAVTSAVRVN